MERTEKRAARAYALNKNEKRERKMAKRVTTNRRPWHYTGCGLDNVFLVGIEVERDPKTGEEEPVIPQLADLHDCIFLNLVSKPGPLGGREIRYLRRHLLWTQAETAEKLGFNSAQYFCELERKRQGFADIGADFLYRFECLDAFIRSARGPRKREARRILADLKDILSGIRKPRKARHVTIKRVHTGLVETWEPAFNVA